MEKIKEYIELIPFGSIWTWAAGFLGGAAAALFGGWDLGLQVLLGFMAVDYVTGLIVAGVFHSSEKSETGGLQSAAGWRGLLRKGVTLLIVYVSCQLDRLMNTSFIRDGVLIAYTANELLSIVENAGLMGVPIPGAIRRAIDILKDEEEEENV